MCNVDDSASDGAAVEECLKLSLNQGLIVDPNCRKEVATIIEESKVDIHTDPLLYRACAVDVKKFCSEIPQGDGRRT